MTIESKALMDESLSLEGLAYGFLEKKFGTKTRISYRDGRMVLGRQYHFTKAQVRILLANMKTKGLLSYGNRGFQLLDGEETSE